MADLRKLFLFDFDGTLFRSPSPPPGWGETALWYESADSLSPPCVPMWPPATWWITSTVQAAKRGIVDPTTYTVLASGRIEHVFKDRIDELVNQAAKLPFNELHLRPHGRTVRFKLNLLGRILRDYPTIDTVEIWEDQETKMVAYRTFVQGQGLICRVHPVKIKAMPARCQAPSPVRVASRWLSASRIRGYWTGYSFQAGGTVRRNPTGFGLIGMPEIELEMPEGIKGIAEAVLEPDGTVTLLTSIGEVQSAGHRPS